MFWGLIMEPGRRYSQIIKRSFHISKACLDVFACDGDPTQVLLNYDDRNYLLCTLQNGHQIQCSLDLNFEAGDKVIFATNGQSNVHLTGYLQEDEDSEEAEETEPKVEEEEKMITEPLITNGKRQIKRRLQKLEKPSPNKKSKLADLLNDEQDYNSDDDDTFVLDEEEDADDSNDEADEDDDENAEDFEDDDEDEEEEDGEAEEDEDVFAASEDEMFSSDNENEDDKPKVNGVSMKKKNQKAKRGDLTDKENKTPKKSETKEVKKTPKVKTPKNEISLKEKKSQTPNQQSPSPIKRSLEGGVIIQDLKVGDGLIAKPNKMVQVYYEGRLKQNNKVFDQNNKGSGFKFRLGKKEVIKGWDVGVIGMKVGGRRRIVCPPQMSYGQKGSPPVIPPNSTLIFEVELKNVL